MARCMESGQPFAMEMRLLVQTENFGGTRSAGAAS
jgi:hypothetical protein